MTGSGGAVTSVDRDASQVGIDVLARGGNAADAAVATAAALGVTEPYSAGIGGGGFLVYYDARTHKVRTIDGRETAPRTFTPTTFTKPDGTAMDFNTVVSSGLSVGVPGTPALWDLAARDFGTQAARRPARTGRAAGPHGLHGRPDLPRPDRRRTPTGSRSSPPPPRSSCPAASRPRSGRCSRTPTWPRPTPSCARKGVNALYRGELGADLVAEARAPHTADGVSVMGGQITRRGPRGLPRAEEGPGPLARTRAWTSTACRCRAPAASPWPRSSTSCATTSCAPAPRPPRSATPTTCTGSARPPRPRSPTATATSATCPACRSTELTSKGFAGERSCLFDPDKAQPRPIPFGSPDGSYTTCAQGATAAG